MKIEPPLSAMEILGRSRLYSGLTILVELRAGVLPSDFNTSASHRHVQYVDTVLHRRNPT
jgi:hypothetical protein